MIKLSDYFQPLNFITLSYFVGMFLFFDILGTFLRTKVLKLDSEDSSRILNWLLGFGIFVFLWFLVSIFIVPGREQILISIGAIVFLTLPGYVREKQYKSLYQEIWKHKLPILIIAPFLPAVFVKSSLPPYYADEMAYHFISPLALKSLTPVRYVSDLFFNLPRNLDSFWILVFSLTKTYSVARLFHFAFLMTSMMYAYTVIKKNFGFLYGFLFVFLFFSLPQDIVLVSTLGYNDIGSMAFLLIGIINGIDFISNKKESSFVFVFLFWGMSLGTKYTQAPSFIAFLLMFSVLIFRFKNEYVRLFNIPLLTKAAAAFAVFGGYWYIKNFVVFGNPIYPFILPCWGKYVADCATGSSFFGDWTMKITPRAVYPILAELFPKNIFLILFVIAAFIVNIFTSAKKVKFVSFALFGSVILELIMLKYFSGFYIRYHQHMQLYLLLAAILILSEKFTGKFMKMFVKFSLLGLLIFSTISYIQTINNTNSHLLSWNEINYSAGRLNIYGWVDRTFPRMSFIARWCDDPPGGMPVQLAKIEPNFVWHNPVSIDDYYMQVFATNCTLYNPLVNIPVDKALQYAIKNKMKFWVASENGCVTAKEAGSSYPNEPESDIPLKILNNSVVCNSSEMGPHLYYFDYSKIKLQ